MSNLSVSPASEQLQLLSCLLVKLQHDKSHDSSTQNTQDTLRKLQSLVPWIVQVEQSMSMPFPATTADLSWIRRCQEIPLLLPPLTANHAAHIEAALSRHFDNNVDFAIYFNRATITDIYCYIRYSRHLLRIVVGQNASPLMIEATPDKSLQSTRIFPLQHTHASLRLIQRRINGVISQRNDIGVADIIIEYAVSACATNTYHDSLQWNPMTSALAFSL